MNLPYATKTTALLSGVTLALILSASERIDGSLHIILTMIGVIWFPVSIVVFVHGKQTIEYKIEAILGKRPALDIPKDITPRALVWFCSTIVAAWAFSHWPK
jgi:hypothetical protein